MFTIQHSWKKKSILKKFVEIHTPKIISAASEGGAKLPMPIYRLLFQGFCSGSAYFFIWHSHLNFTSKWLFMLQTLQKCIGTIGAGLCFIFHFFNFINLKIIFFLVFGTEDRNHRQQHSSAFDWIRSDLEMALSHYRILSWWCIDRSLPWPSEIVS